MAIRFAPHWGDWAGKGISTEFPAMSNRTSGYPMASVTRASARWLRTIAVTSAAMLVASCDEGVLDPDGPVGKAERIILYDSTAIMLAVVIPVIVLTLVFAWWFRAKNSRARYRPDWEYSGRIEMIIWSIPALVILFLGGIAWTGSHNLDPPAPLEGSATPLDIEVISLDWRWKIHQVV